MSADAFYTQLEASAQRRSRDRALVERAEAWEAEPMEPLKIGAYCVVKGTEPDTYRVVCASCGAAGALLYESRGEARRVLIKYSDRPCRVCGAEH